MIPACVQGRFLHVPNRCNNISNPGEDLFQNFMIWIVLIQLFRVKINVQSPVVIGALSAYLLVTLPSVTMLTTT